jgi:hypothetical protein
LHQQPKHVEAAVLGQRRQGRDGICLFHISTNMEIIIQSQVEGRLPYATPEPSVRVA